MNSQTKNLIKGIIMFETSLFGFKKEEVSSFLDELINERTKKRKSKAVLSKNCRDRTTICLTESAITSID